MNLIAKRGYYNASEMDANIAKKSQRGLAMLADAGEELIGNTFVVINDFKYVSKEEVANKTKKGLSLLSSVVSVVPGVSSVSSTVSNVNTVSSAGLTVAGKGYVIKTTSYLYRLVWTPEIAAIFYNDYWTEDASFDANKKLAFENSNIFKLKFIGSEEAWADLQSSVFTSKSEEELIRIATIKAIDAGIAKLQRKFEEFRTKSPLYSGDPLSAKIGLKEGLEAGDKFEVLEQTIDNEGKTFYKRMGIIKVDETQIWDNRYMAGEENPINKNGYTLFKGSKGFSSGMLIKQIN